KISAVRPLGLFGHMLWLSGTLGDALERAVKHYALVTQRTMLRLETSGSTVTITSVPMTREPRGRVLTEFPFASLALRARHAVGETFRLRAVRFTHAGEDSADYAAVFGCPVTFGAAADQIELDASLLEQPLASADP